MTIHDIQKIIQNNKHDIAFIVGNGINRYPNNPNALSWDELLIKLWDKVSLQTLSKRPKGISLTEFYDILELENTRGLNLQKEVADLMSNWSPTEHHQRIVNRIAELNAPILTTNFEETLAKTFPFQLLKTETENFTDFYPWSSYHGSVQHQCPSDGFGLWYINGMINYHRSIRLGLSHYMGCVERARNLLHKTGDENLYSAKDDSMWKGRNTWLHSVFNKSLFVFGLGLEENETFLRWLLIERIKYFKQFPERKHKGWYITKKNENTGDSGKKFFLERVGFEVIELDHYKDIYESVWT